MKKVLMVGNTDFSIYIYRKELAQRLLDEGYQVYVSSPTGDRVPELLAMGCQFIETKVSSYGLNPFKEFLLLLKYFQIITTIKPDIVLTYTIKPNVYAGFISRITNTPYICNITGMGSAVENGGILQKISLLLMKIGMKDAKTIFFQNQSNMEFLTNKNIGKENGKLIPGSGVNLTEHQYEEYPDEENRINILFIGRIIQPKGVDELFEAIEFIRKKYSNKVHFHICGSSSKKYDKKIQKLNEYEEVSYYGKVKNIHDYIKECHAVLLPSYHEGMANVLLEAAATGRVILASRIPGCIETFDENISGIGFAPKSSKELIYSIEKFINLSHNKKKNMGKAGRQKIQKEFSREIVTIQYMKEL